MEEMKLELTRQELDLLYDALDNEKLEWEMLVRRMKKEAEETGEKQYERWGHFSENRIEKVKKLIAKLEKIGPREHSSKHLSK